MRELFYELIQEASTGKVIFGDEEWPVGFNTKILEDNTEKYYFRSDRNISMLYIKDEEEFFKVLEDYIKIQISNDKGIPQGLSEEEKIKWIMMYLFAYATTEDFTNPVEYIRRRIDFLNDHTFDELNNKVTISLNDKIPNVDLEIVGESSPITMETPKKILFDLRETNDDVIYRLPDVYYAIREENNEKVCYIYSIIHKNNRKETTPVEEKFKKRMNRLLFKTNDGVTDKEEYNIEDESNIKDVSMSFVFTLNIFISLLQRKGIEKIKAVPYLPVSYLAREITASESDRKEELRERNDRIQTNQTNKFIRTFRRLCAQNDALKVITYPYEYDEFLTLSLTPRKKELDNMLLEETNKKVVEEITK